MALVTGQQFKVVRVNTQAQYNDIANKDGGTAYWIVETQKIMLDGTPYGFNTDDVSATLLNSRITTEGDALVTFTKSVVGGALQLKAVFRVDPDTRNMLAVTGSGLMVNNEMVIGLAQDAAVTAIETRKGVANGLASLDHNGKVPSAQLPGYVDDVIEVANFAALPVAGEAGKLYVTKDTNKVYRWTGSIYVEVSSSLALGETSSTAYRGDRGKTAYDHTLLKDNPHGVTKTQVGLGSVSNYGVATTAEAQAGTVDTKYMTPQKTKEAIDKLAYRTTWTVIS